MHIQNPSQQYLGICLEVFRGALWLGLLATPHLYSSTKNNQRGLATDTLRNLSKMSSPVLIGYSSHFLLAVLDNFMLNFCKCQSGQSQGFFSRGLPADFSQSPFADSWAHACCPVTADTNLSKGVIMTGRILAGAHFLHLPWNPLLMRVYFYNRHLFWKLWSFQKLLYLLTFFFLSWCSVAPFLN